MRERSALFCNPLFKRSRSGAAEPCALHTRHIARHSHSVHSNFRALRLSEMPRNSTALWALVLACAIKKKKRRKNREVWTKQWLFGRQTVGSYQQIFQELSRENTVDFHNYIRLPVNVFHSLLNKIKPLIEREDTTMRQSISAGARLEATLLFLATGCTFTRLQYLTRISRASLSTIVPEICQAIYDVLKDDYMKVSNEDYIA